MSVQTIELDCAPGTPRPDTYIEGILEGTGIAVREPVNKFFGNWTWNFADVPAELWESTREIRKQRITALYNQGCIRFGSW